MQAQSSSFLPTLFSLNRPLSTRESEHLAELILAEQISVKQFDEKIKEAEEHLNLLRAQRERRVRHIFVLKGFLFPVLRLPTEVLREIFLCVLSYGRSEPVATQKDLDVALRLCAVCQQWRELAVSMPELWQRLTVSVPRLKQIPVAVEPVNTWLSRATASFPVDLAMIYYDDPVAQTLANQLLSSIFSAYGSIIGRISVSISGAAEAAASNDVAFLDGAFADARTSCPLLRNIEVLTGENNDTCDWYSADGLHVTRSPIPWAQLHCLRIDDLLSPVNAARMLALCPNLVECSICLSGYSSIVHFPQVAVVDAALPYLRVLKLDLYDDCPYYSYFLDCLSTLSSLKILDIVLDHDIGGASDHGFTQSLMNLKDRSSFDLESIAIRDGYHDMAGEALIGLISEMPSLSSVYISDTPAAFTQSFSRALTFNHSTQILNLAPNLRRLDIVFLKTWPWYEDLDEETSILESFMDVVESRCPPPSHVSVLQTGSLLANKVYLEHVNLEMHADPAVWQENAAVLQRAEHWKERGILDVRLA